jgi:hypothetical protein
VAAGMTPAALHAQEGDGDVEGEGAGSIAFSGMSCIVPRSWAKNAMSYPATFAGSSVEVCSRIT